MQRLAVFILIPAMLAASCAARGAATAVRVQDPPELWQRYAAKLPLGSGIRIATTDGDRFAATLVIVDDTGITVLPETRVPEPARHVAFGQLVQLELRSSGRSPGERAGAVGIGIATAAAVFLGSLFLLFLLAGD